MARITIQLSAAFVSIRFSFLKKITSLCTETIFSYGSYYFLYHKNRCCPHEKPMIHVVYALFTCVGEMDESMHPSFLQL